MYNKEQSAQRQHKQRHTRRKSKQRRPKNSMESIAPKRFVRGGELLLLKDEIAHRGYKTGNDPSQLGRWAWSLLEGKGGLKTRQQRRFFLSNNQDRNPREALFEDLDKEIQLWREAGENIIIAGDFNGDVRSGDISKWMKQWGLRDSILTIHGSNAPPTHNKG